jgi:hypothetical protein
VAVKDRQYLSADGKPLRFRVEKGKKKKVQFILTCYSNYTRLCPGQIFFVFFAGALSNAPHAELVRALNETTTLILYPGPGAKNIEEMEDFVADEEGGREGGREGGARTLIVVDGTWKQAGRVCV